MRTCAAPPHTKFLYISISTTKQEHCPTAPPPYQKAFPGRRPRRAPERLFCFYSFGAVADRSGRFLRQRMPSPFNTSVASHRISCLQCGHTAPHRPPCAALQQAGSARLHPCKGNLPAKSGPQTKRLPVHANNRKQHREVLFCLEKAKGNCSKKALQGRKIFQKSALSAGFVRAQAAAAFFAFSKGAAAESLPLRPVFT